MRVCHLVGPQWVSFGLDRPVTRCSGPNCSLIVHSGSGPAPSAGPGRRPLRLDEAAWSSGPALPSRQTAASAAGAHARDLSFPVATSGRLPQVIRADTGVPFASPHALHGLRRLSVWWLRLGIQIERIKPGHPEQNGRHERMHLTLKAEATKPAAAGVLEQQARFDTFIEQYNREHPTLLPRGTRRSR